MLKYRLKFEFVKSNKSKDRDNIINGILSDINSIISDNPIRKPLDGEEILINDAVYKVLKTTISFQNDDNITYYDFNVLLKSKIEIEEEILKKKEIEKEIEKKIQKKLEYDDIRDRENQKYKDIAKYFNDKIKPSDTDYNIFSKKKL